jgi:ribosome-binding factor A
MWTSEHSNSVLQAKLGEILVRHLDLPDALVTISFVDCTSDWQEVKIGVSVLPESHSGSALSALRRLNKVISDILRKEYHKSHAPRLQWLIDDSEKEARKMDIIIDNLD